MRRPKPAVTEDVETTNMAYREAVGYLYGLQKYGIKFGLSKTSSILDSMGNPQIGQNYVHIAGTNGKGSVAAFLASMLEGAGFRVGLYSSPHLVRFTERFRINGVEMSQDTAARLIHELRQVVVEREPPTFFEAATAMALAHFAREGTDLTIMEVGMGGRLDATNIIHPLVSVITNISLEHQTFLGKRLNEIAREKGGIIKPDVDLVTGVEQPRVIRVLEDLCRQRKSPMWRIGNPIRYRMTSSGLHYYGIKRRINGLHPGLKGDFQKKNAVLALAAAELLEDKGFRLSDNQVRTGLQKASWPGRMQVVSENPTVMLDGAHNPGAARALAGAIKRDFHYRRLILVVGIMDDKDIGNILRWIVPMAHHVIYTRPAYYRAAKPERLMAEGSPYGGPGEIIQGLSSALERAVGLGEPEDLVVVCGSLFTVGEALSYFDPERYPAENLGD